MKTVLRAVALSGLAAVAASAAQDAGSPPPTTPVGAAGATAAAVPRPRRGRRPIHDSAQRRIEALVRAHMDPCETARGKGVPCFPVSIETEGPRFSVAESIRTYRPGSGPTPGVPTRAEIQQQMSGAPLSASGGVSSDPACAVKSLVRLFKGSPNTFFLYRIWNEKGEEEPLLADRKLDPGSYASPAVRYEFVGTFKGECEAIAAWRRALRGTVAPRPAGEGTLRTEPPQ